MGEQISVYERNMLVIRRRWPRVAALIDKATTDGLQWQRGEGGKYDGAILLNGRQMTPGYDRTTAAVQACETASRDANPQWCFGVGCGDIPRELVKRNKRTVVVVMNAAVTRASMDCVYQADWLEEKKVHLVMAKDIAPTLNIPSAAPLTCVPMEVKFCDTSAYPVRDQVFSLVNERFNEGIQYRAQLENDTAHWQANKPRMESEDKPVESLFGSRPGANVIVATSGPSLDGQLEWLRGHRDTSILVTVNSSLRTLMRAGIVPDYVVVIDSNEIIAKDLDTLEVEPLKSSTLVYEPVVTPKLVQAWPGPRCYSVNKVLWASGSVLHPAVDLAVKLGAKSVTLLGADFCYVSNRYYTTGAANKVPIMPDVAASMPTFDGNGNETSTQPSLARYHRHLERYIAEHPEVQWFKRGRKGVEIRGAQWLD